MKKVEKMIIVLLELLNILNTGLCSNSVLVLRYNKRNDCQNPLVLIKPSKALNEFTYCAKYNFRFLRNIILIDGANFDMRLFITDFERKIGFFKYDGGSYLFDFKYQNLKPDEWHHICLSISRNQFIIVLNGQILLNEKVDIVTKEILNPDLWLGGTNSTRYLDRHFVGLITDVHLWSQSLTIEDIVSITETNTISNTSFPDLFTWPKFEIKSNTTCIEYLVKDDNDELLQNKPPQKIMLVEDLKNFDSSNYLCQAYGGKLFVPESYADLSKISLLFEQSSGNCNSAYFGLKKSINLVNVTDLDSNTISFVNWGKNQPNGKEYQQCIRIKKDTFYDDVTCFYENCFLCKIPTKNIYKLRGQIPKGIEEKYSVGFGLTSKDTKIRGIQEIDCFWNGTWIFGQDFKLPQPSSNMPPVGVHKWNDEHVLKFTQCNEDKFTCQTYGHCIAMEKRCDGHPDCPEDGSDENECKIMSFKKGYDKKYPSSKNTIVSISMEVMDLTQINELNMDYTIEVKIMMKWYDSRITFRNLKPTHYENQLNDEEKDQIWNPELEFLHLKGIQRHRWYVNVHRDGMPQLNSLTNINEDYIYPGNENPISMVDYYIVKLGCKFNLEKYPFDTQRCPISLKRPSSFANQFVVNWDGPPVINNLKLTQYDNLLKLGYNNSSKPKTTIEVEIILCRKITYHIVNIYIPTLSLIMIAGFTLFIDYSHFEVTIMVALTSMLVTYTLYQSISGYLPQTSYMKMIDIWLFGGLFFPFIIITILIIMDSLIMKEKNQVIDMKTGIRLNSKSFMKWMKVSLFAVSGIFCAIYWSYGLYHFYFDCSI